MEKGPYHAGVCLSVRATPGRLLQGLPTRLCDRWNMSCASTCIHPLSPVKNPAVSGGRPAKRQLVAVPKRLTPVDYKLDCDWGFLHWARVKVFTQQDGICKRNYSAFFFPFKPMQPFTSARNFNRAKKPFFLLVQFCRGETGTARPLTKQNAC